jgi:hypothetical protein
MAGATAGTSRTLSKPWAWLDARQVKREVPGGPVQQQYGSMQDVAS